MKRPHVLLLWLAVAAFWVACQGCEESSYPGPDGRVRHQIARNEAENLAKGGAEARRLTMCLVESESAARIGRMEKLIAALRGAKDDRQAEEVAIELARERSSLGVVWRGIPADMRAKAPTAQRLSEVEAEFESTLEGFVKRFPKAYAKATQTPFGAFGP